MIVGFEDYKNNYKFNVRGIVHIGAHIGQEYEEYIEKFGNIETHWFEPIPELKCSSGFFSTKKYKGYKLIKSEKINR